MIDLYRPGLEGRRVGHGVGSEETNRSSRETKVEVYGPQGDTSLGRSVPVSYMPSPWSPVSLPGPSAGTTGQGRGSISSDLIGERCGHTNTDRLRQYFPVYRHSCVSTPLRTRNKYVSVVPCCPYTRETRGRRFIQRH